MREVVGDEVLIKASGGIKTKEFADELIKAGAEPDRDQQLRPAGHERNGRRRILTGPSGHFHCAGQTRDAPQLPVGGDQRGVKGGGQRDVSNVVRRNSVPQGPGNR